MGKYLWLVYVLGVVVSWGSYVTVLEHGRNALKGPNSPYRAFLFIGVAYFVVGVIIPGLLILLNSDADKGGAFTSKGVWLSTAAGVLGAIGALCIVFALKAAKSGGIQGHLYVPVLVFAFAPIVNTCIVLIMERKVPNWQFLVGMLLASAGAALVISSKHFAEHKTPQADAPTESAQSAQVESQANADSPESGRQ